MKRFQAELKTPDTLKKGKTTLPRTNGHPAYKHQSPKWQKGFPRPTDDTYSSKKPVQTKKRNNKHVSTFQGTSHGGSLTRTLNSPVWDYAPSDLTPVENPLHFDLSDDMKTDFSATLVHSMNQKRDLLLQTDSMPNINNMNNDRFVSDTNMGGTEENPGQSTPGQSNTSSSSLDKTDSARKVRIEATPWKFVKVLPSNEHSVPVDESNSDLDDETDDEEPAGGPQNPVSSHDLHPSLARRHSSYAKDVTWFYITGSHTAEAHPGVPGSEHALPTVPPAEGLKDMYMEEVLAMDEKPYQPRLGKNQRAKMNCCSLMWYDFKVSLQRQRNKTRENPVFKKSIQLIESHFGSGIVSFFIFARWMFLLNVALCVAWLSLVVLPQAFFFDYDKLSSGLFFRNLLDGQDALSESWLFYGNYNSELGIFPLDLVYFICILLTYFGSLFVVLSSIASAIEEEGEGIGSFGEHHYPFFLLTISSWDYTIKSREGSRNLSRGIANTFKDMMSERKAKDTEQSRSTKDKCFIFTRRSTAWLITLVLIGLGCTAIFFMNMSVDIRVVFAYVGYTDMPEDHFAVEFAPIIVFMLINSLVPVCLYQLPRMEKYVRGKEELMVSISRVFILRMANLVSLVLSLYKKVEKGNFNGCAGTLIGRELYKLVIIDTVVHTLVQIIPKFGMYFWSGQKAEFRMPPVVLVVIYRQALIWLGTLVCPLMPFIGTLSMAVFFLVNYLVVSITCKPPKKRWNQPRRSTFFMGITAATLAILIVLVSIIIGRDDLVRLGQVGNNTTATCGPFGSRTVLSVFAKFNTELSQYNTTVAEILRTCLSGTVLTPFVFILLAVLYFQRVRLDWESKKKRVLVAELLEERDINKDLMKKLQMMTSQSDDYRITRM